MTGSSRKPNVRSCRYSELPRAALVKNDHSFLSCRVPRVTEEYRVARRDEIAEAALRAFRRKGFQATSMAEIIAESGLSAGAIYGHYASKDAIIVDVASRVVGNRILDVERLARTEPLPPPPTIPRVLIAGMLRAIGNPAIMLQLWGEGVTDPEMSSMIGPIFDEVRGVMGPYLARWARERGGMAPDAAAAWADDLVPVFPGLGQGYIIQSALLPAFDADGYFRGVSALLDGGTA